MSIRFLPVLLSTLILTGAARAASIFTTQLPASGDSSPNSRSVELGVRFRADSAGQITGLRFYKTAGNTGTHTGHLWTNTGTLLGSLTFTGETATGWQSASFASPIAIQAGTTYVASYHTAAIYAVTRLTFSAAGIDNPPLRALRDGLDGVNGSYVYSSVAAFPNRGTRSSNYWIDVIFSASGPDAVAPTVTISSPTGGATVRGIRAVLAAASDDVAVTTVQFKLDGAALGAPDLLAPYAASWNTVLSSDGAHVLTAVAWDAAGNASTSAAVSVTVDNTPPLISSAAVANVGASSAAVSWITNEPASSQVEYGTSTAYGSLTALDASTVTSHARILSGLISGTLYHYRARSADAAGNLAVSGDATFTTSSPPPAPACLTSAGAWMNLPFPTMSGSFVAGFDAKPHAAGMDGVMGLSNGPASAFSQLANVVRFNTAGFIDARNGGVYAAAGPIPYSPGTEYHFTLEVSLASHTYTAYVSSPSASRQLVGSNFAFRTEQSEVVALNNMGFIADIGSATVCGVSVVSDTVPPTVAISSPLAGALIAGSVAVTAAAFDDVAVATVQFKLDGAALGAPDSSPPYAAVWNTALSSDGAHSLTAVAWDAAGNASTSAAVPVVVDNTPPVISAVAVASIGQSSATVAWTTDEPASSQVEYGTSAAYGSLTALDASTVTSHARLLAGLASGTSYHYRVRSTDAAGNLAVSGGFIFSTVVGPDLTPPTVAVSSPAAGSVIAGTVTVTAAAFDDVAVATVQFRLDGAALGPADAAAPYAFAWDTASSSDGPHSLSAVAWDAAGNPSTSAVVSVTVDNAPPLISSVAAVDVGIDSATVAWTTDEPATARVEFGTTAAYGSFSALDSSTAAGHAIILSGLSSGTTYHYRVRSSDAAGNLAVSDGFTFATIVVPDLTPPTVAISSPDGGSVIAGTVAVAAAAFDGVAVATVQFRLDGEDLGPPDAAAPYGLGWNTALSSDGPHSLSAVAWDTAGNASTAAAVAVITDNTPPLISSVVVAAAGIDYAALAWVTGEPATSQVEYGTSTAYGGSTALDASTVAAHDAFLSGLSTGTLYHYRVRSADALGNLAVSADSTFTTALAAPAVSFFDDFSAYTPDVCLADGEVFGPWTSVFNGYGCTSVRTDGGRFWLEESPFASASSSETHAALVSGLSFTSPMIMSVDVRTTSQLRTNSPPNPWEVAWVVWNYTDNAHFYYFIPKPNGWELGKVDPAYPGGQRFLAAGSSPVFPIGIARHVKISQTQNVLSAYVDGVLITTFTDRQRPYTSGHISLYTEDAVARFTNVAVNIATPSVSILSPQGGVILAGSAAVTAAAFDDVAVATVQFRVDGADLGLPDDTAPYTAIWNTAVSSDGGHSLTALAWDADGNVSTSAAVSVTVDNTAPLISSVAVTDLGSSSATLAWITGEPATSRVEYGTTTAYGGLTALGLSTVTSHARVASGLTAGTLYHYRVLSADAAGNLAFSDDGTFTTSEAGVGCQTSSGVWRNASFAPQVSSFTVSFDVTPSSAGMDASIGLSSGVAGALAGLAAAVRFNPQGFIDVRYSTSYARMSTVAYSTGTSYRFDLRVNASAHIFDVYVTTPGSSRILLARNYTFHSNQSTATVLDNLGLFASPGAATMCNLTVSASTVPWWDGIRELYATAAGSKTWYSSWDNGIDRAFTLAKDPTDPWFDAVHGTANYLVDAASGVFKISGNTPRMYIHHPDFVTGSSSLTVADSHSKQWHDVEMTVYGMRIADSNVAWAGIDGIARSNHGISGDETVRLCDSRGIGARFRNNGRLDFEKETRHPTAYAVATTTTALWPSGTALPFNVWIGFKYVVYDLPNGNVKVENYMDMTNGAGGGSWVLVNRFEDNGTNWGGGTPCAPGVNPQERLTNSSDRPGSESGLPNVTVYFRSDGVGTNGLLYKKMSVREIVAPSGGAGPLAAAGEAAGSAGAAPAAAEEAFLFRDLYAFPNPSRRGERVTIRLQAGLADAVDVDIFDLSGRRVNGGSAEGPVLVDDGNGKGAQFTYDYHWNVSGARSAVYLYKVNARKQGQPGIGRTGKVALIK